MSEQQQIQLAPAPRRGYRAKVYDVLKNGPMTRQAVKLATGIPEKQLQSALYQCVNLGYIVHGQHNHRYAIAPMSVYESRSTARQKNQEALRKLNKKKTATINTKISGVLLERVDAEVERRKAAGAKGANRNAVLKEMAAKALKPKPRKRRATKTAEVEQPTASPWWKFWS